MANYERTAVEALREARSNLPLGNLIFELTGQRVGKRSDCVFCQKKQKFGIYARQGSERFKCFASDCKANQSGDDVAFVSLWMNLDRKAAFKEFLKLAGVS